MADIAENVEKIWREYEHAERLEQDLDRTRWTFFTAMLSVSFLVGGLALNQLHTLGALLAKFGFGFGWLIFMAGCYHFWFFHHKSHKLRDHLCNLERDHLHINVYRIASDRPHEFHHHWGIVVLAVAYTIVLVLVLAH